MRPGSYTGSDSDSPRISLALFDSQLDQLKLPVLRHPAAEENKSPSRLENVAFFVQKYFDLVAVFEEGLFMFSFSTSYENYIFRRYNVSELIARGGKRRAGQTTAEPDATLPLKQIDTYRNS
jgi:hypothetical protein